MSGEHQHDVQDDDDDLNQRSPQNGSPFEDRQNIPPRHQRFHQTTSTRHQSHSPIVMQRPRHPRSPSTRHFRSSPTQLSRSQLIQKSPYRDQGSSSSRHHRRSAHHDRGFSRHDQDTCR
jgi:hypothetical protein